MTLRTITLTCLLALVLSVPLAAQTHPCYQPITVTAKAGELFAIGFCHPKKTAPSPGYPTGEDVTITQVRVVIDSVERFKGPLSSSATASADGNFYFETPQILSLSTVGTHIGQVFVSSPDGESPAASLSISITPASLVPSAPVRVRVVRAAS